MFPELIGHFIVFGILGGIWFSIVSDFNLGQDIAKKKKSVANIKKHDIWSSTNKYNITWLTEQTW